MTITQVFVLIFERQKPLFLQNLAKNSALKRLRLEDTYAARQMKIRPPLHVCLNNSVARPSFKILSGIFERWSSNRVI